MGVTVGKSNLALKIEPLSPVDDDRRRRLLEALRTRSVVCICGLSLEFQIGSADVTEIMEREVAEGRFSQSHLQHGEPVYVSNQVPFDRDEFKNVVEDIEFAIGITEDCFPGYRRGEDLGKQSVGPLIKAVLRAAINV